MPDMLVGHGITDMVIDCTEFKFQHATDLDLNSLMFPNYRNTVTGKVFFEFQLMEKDFYPAVFFLVQ